MRSKPFIAEELSLSLEVVWPAQKRHKRGRRGGKYWNRNYFSNMQAGIILRNDVEKNSEVIQGGAVFYCPPAR